MKTVEFIFDFGSPNAYLAHRVIPAVEARTGAAFTYNPCLLGGIFKATGNRSPFEHFAGVRNKLDYERLEIRRFVQRHHIDAFRMNPHFPVNTLLMMRGAVVAQEAGTLAPYVEACFRAMWEDGEKMDDPAVAGRVLDAAGLDGRAILEHTQDQGIKDRLIANTENVVERGVFGIPTFFVGDEMFFGKDRLVQVEEEIIRAGA
ncbi:MAG: 2-hydroxychromene-2-carboxylate isomerase [Rhizobiaceae bacterium]